LALIGDRKEKNTLIQIQLIKDKDRGDRVTNFHAWKNVRQMYSRVYRRQNFQLVELYKLGAW
jgi:hypothetical protein